MLSSDTIFYGIWPVFCDTYWSALENDLKITPTAGSDLCLVTPRLNEQGSHTLTRIGSYWAGMLHAHNNIDPYLLFYHMHNVGRDSSNWVAPERKHEGTWLYRCFMNMAGHGISLDDDFEVAHRLESAWKSLFRHVDKPDAFSVPDVDQHQWLGDLAESHARQHNRVAYLKFDVAQRKAAAHG